MITDYTKNKESIDIAVFVSQNNSILSKLIRFCTKSKWSHTGFVVKEVIESVTRWVVYQADFKKGIVEKYPASYVFEKLQYQIYPVEYVNRGEIVAKLQDIWGRTYDISGALLAPFVDTYTRNEVFCSEMVREVLSTEESVAPFFALVRPYINRGIYPDDIAKVMDAYEESKKKHL